MEPDEIVLDLLHRVTASLERIAACEEERNALLREGQARMTEETTKTEARVRALFTPEELARIDEAEDAITRANRDAQAALDER